MPNNKNFRNTKFNQRTHLEAYSHSQAKSVTLFTAAINCLLLHSIENVITFTAPAKKVRRKSNFPQFLTTIFTAQTNSGVLCISNESFPSSIAFSPSFSLSPPLFFSAQNKPTAYKSKQTPKSPNPGSGRVPKNAFSKLNFQPLA